MKSSVHEHNKAYMKDFFICSLVFNAVVFGCKVTHFFAMRKKNESFSEVGQAAEGKIEKKQVKIDKNIFIYLSLFFIFFFRRRAATSKIFCGTLSAISAALGDNLHGKQTKCL